MPTLGSSDHAVVAVDGNDNNNDDLQETTTPSLLLDNTPIVSSQQQPHDVVVTAPRQQDDNEEQQCCCDVETTEETSRNSSRNPNRKRHGASNQHKMRTIVQWLIKTFQLLDSKEESGVPVQMGTDDDATSPTATSRCCLPHQQQHHHILDVAGGKGELAARLTMCHRMHVTMVDPRPAKIESVYTNTVVPRLPKKWQQQLLNQCHTNPTFVHDILQERFQQLILYFTNETIMNDIQLQHAIERSTLLIGIHADSATECIVDVALQYRKPFIVIPCCVFPNLFHQRYLLVPQSNGNVNHVDSNGNSIIYVDDPNNNADGDNNPQNAVQQQQQQQLRKVPVRSWDQFCDYLLQKDPRFRRDVLPFDGRNVAIWWDGK